MLIANKSKFFEIIFSLYNRNLIKRRFHSLQISGLDFLFDKHLKIPLIIYCNHSSWWDGLVAFQISYEANLDSYLMMEEKQLEKLFLFRKVGAFSIVREKPRQAIESINYASKLLIANSQKTLWIFPQGEILPNDSRPIYLFNGLSRIIEKVAQCLVIPLVIRYEFLGKFKPQIFVKIGEPKLIFVDLNFNAKDLTERLTIYLTRTLDELKKDVLNHNTERYKSII
ncbi:MAG: lysophospholipid acyltransferase family protein [Actinomycetota bacterium]